MDINEYNTIIQECRELSIRKNKDYGDDSLKQFGSYGILVRLTDKIMRLNNLLRNKMEPLTNEKIDDTLKDIINYSVYMIMMERGSL